MLNTRHRVGVANALFFTSPAFSTISSTENPVNSNSMLKFLFVTLIALLVVCSSGEFELVILHTNDMHGRFEQTSRNSGTCKEGNGSNDCVGGFARLAHEVKRIRTSLTGKDVLFLNAGDTYTGTTWFALYKHNITLEFMNSLDFDVVVSNI